MVRQRQPRAVKLVIIFVALTVFVLGACGGRTSEFNQINISIIPSQAAIKPGGQELFHASVQGEIPPNVTFQWTSSDPKIASVNEDGVATGLDEGTTSIFVAVAGQSAGATLAVRPVEILDVTPMENQIVPRSGPPCRPLCLMPQLDSVGADFNFPGEDFFQSARLFIDGGEVTSDSLLQVLGKSTGPLGVKGHEEGVEGHGESETVVPRGPISPNEVPGIEGSILYPRLLELPLGSHQVTVEAKSREGKTVTYTWSFTLTE